MKRQPTVQQITWFLDLHRTGQLDLTPVYQRKSVWTLKDRRFFLDSIFRNYPCPPLFIHKTITDSGFTEYHIVDGKQRIESFLMYSQDKFTLDKEFGDITFNGKLFSELTTPQKRLFWDYSFTVEFLDVDNDEAVNLVFDRVNRNAKNLKAQELRHARYSGWFISIAEDESEESFWEDFKISTKARSKRMDNIQFISELLLTILDNKIVGFSHDYLDDRTAHYDDISDESLEIDADDFKLMVQNIKAFIVAMEKTNGCISKYSRSQAVFYTLWAFVFLNFDAALFSQFMEKVQKIRDNNASQKELSLWKEELAFSENLRGASTDFPQRTGRMSALCNAVLTQIP
jgi:hypothetical protein